MMKHRLLRILLALGAVLILAVIVYNIPYVNDRLAWRLDALRAEWNAVFNPPEEQVFVPVAATTLPTAQVQVTAPPTAAATAQPTPTPTQPGPTPTATIPPTPLPQRVDLKGNRVYVDQKNRWNYCGPANLTMALKFWDWKGLPGNTMDLRDQIATVVKPGFVDPSKDFISRGRLDLNVMPSEMVDFVANHTDFSALVRYGGNVDVLRALIAAGFPAIIEKGYYEIDTQGKRTWMGHYLFVTGYDDSEKAFIVQDAYYLDGQSPRRNILYKYDALMEGWRAFNYLFMVVYPGERESEIYTTLGQWGDPRWANEHALALANADIASLQGIDLYFAWFNKGTSHIQRLEYTEAASAYDNAFTLYASLNEDNNHRPYRMMWYQTGPYKAYFQTGRHQDVINLANVTLATPSTGPTLEESLFWRAMSAYILGDTQTAYKDMRETVRLNPNFEDGRAILQQWGVAP